jgi:hypothetical protein
VRWVKSILGEGTVVKPTHIALFDIADKECLQEIDLEPFGMNTVFGIFPGVELNAFLNFKGVRDRVRQIVLSLAGALNLCRESTLGFESPVLQAAQHCRNPI